ncbi:PAS domain S-box protein [Runella slithyformis]|uniref:histidine kinase n=1 Tax=Runella slithyformis (strain ATCC 29530 / DSM 19594 / LMG 11500 / NCIMB 11436 / LSU 4) TaxID=761193 RepID=A0A7U3ZRF7_RUNSL|nr:PAS domain S-box protein [Runella slithyformis]AEI52002.1 PAS/PAC sensor signal transduction histidine kinase [Runella slithyformis DSM 19594]
MKVIDCDLSNEKELAGLFMGRPVKSSEGQVDDICIYWQKPHSKPLSELPGLRLGTYLGDPNVCGIRLPALFWPMLQAEGTITCDLTIDAMRFELQVAAVEEHYIISIQRILTNVVQKEPIQATMYNDFFTNADVGIVFMDRNGLIKEVNPALEKMTGYKAEELVNTVTATTLRVPEVHQRQMTELLPFISDKSLTGEKIILAYLEEKGILKRENTLLRKDGGQLPILSTVTKVFNRTGGCLGFVNYLFDISELKQTQAGLFKANERLTLATQAGKVGIWEFNTLTKEYTWDEETYKIHGVSPKEPAALTMSYFLSLVHPQDRDYILSKSKEVDEKEFDLEPIRIIRPDGKLRYIKYSGRRLYNNQATLADVIGVVMDVTDRHLAQLALTQSEKMYRFLVNNLKAAIFEMDLQGNLIYLNSFWKEMTGFETEPALGTNCMEFIHPEDRPINSERFSSLMSRKTTEVRHEIRHRTQDGGYRWVELFAKLTLDETGQPNGSIGTLYDISDRKRIEEVLSESEKRFKAIFNSTFQYMALTDTAGNILEVNQSSLKAGGDTYEEVAGKPFWKMNTFKLSPHTQEQLLHFFHSAANGQAVHREVEIYNETQQCHTVDFSIKPIRNDQGAIVSLLTEGRNITQEKNAKQALLESEQRFREIAENVDEIFWSRAGDEAKFLYINPAYERITGQTCQQLYDDPTSLLEIVAEEDRPALQRLLTANVSEDYSTELRLKVKDGSFHWFRARIFIIRDEKGNVRRKVGIAGDITLQKEKEMLLTKSLEKEKELNMLKSQFVSYVSHEFRTPLTVVQSSIELVQHYLFNANGSNLNEQYASKIKHHFSVINNKIQYFTNLLTDILTLQQIEIGKISFFPQPTDIVILATDVLNEFFADRPDERFAELRTEGTPRPIMLDEKLITRILINLLSNAFKFSNTNPRLCLVFQEQQLKIEIIDGGIGIPAEDIPRLFTTFFRAGNVDGIGGTGLGLQISKQLVELHGGYIEVDSCENKGTTMTIVIPSLH